MSSGLLLSAAFFYLLSVGMLCIYGINFYYLSYVAVKNKRHKEMISEPETWPMVSLQLPIYNEMYVAQRLIQAAAAVDYPIEKLEIQVLDDSTDETFEIVRKVVEKLQTEGINIAHLHRKNREGFKAGALRDGLSKAQGEFIAIFDADFIPTKDFLKKTVPHFRNPEIAFVQGRWEHLNRGYSLLTLFQSLAIDAHFMVEQFSRYLSGFIFNFNGTAGVWRKAAIEDAGGWQPRTLTEDLDLSYRAFLKGWRGIFLKDVTVPAEIPVTFAGYRRQQHRWARGSLENAVILMPKIWQSDLSLKIKIGATLHLTGYLVHILLFALSLIYPFIVLLSLQFPSLVSLFGIALFFNFTALAPTIFFIIAQLHLQRKWWKWLPAILLVSVFGSGMMLNTVRAAWEALRGKANEFERTPKHGIIQKGQAWRKHKYQIKLDGIVFFEFALGLVNLFSSYIAFIYRHWFITFYTMIFGIGLFFVSLYTIGQSIHAVQKS